VKELFKVKTLLFLLLLFYQFHRAYSIFSVAFETNVGLAFNHIAALFYQRIKKSLDASSFGCLWFKSVSISKDRLYSIIR
jgi:hypothetical protein